MSKSKLEHAIAVLETAASMASKLSDEDEYEVERECWVAIAECVAAIWNSHCPENAAKVGSEPLDFGKYQGELIDDVPLGYLDALFANRAQNDRIRGYLLSKCIREERSGVRGRHPIHPFASTDWFLEDEMPYPLSKDYKRLWQELQRESIVCFADWRPAYETSRVIRDVCQTKWDGKTASACCRGVTYAWADNEADFLASCQEAGIEAVFPSVPCESVDSPA